MIHSLCKQLGLNRGNIYTCLNIGNITKVGKAAARLLMEAAEA